MSTIFGNGICVLIITNEQRRSSLNADFKRSITSTSTRLGIYVLYYVTTPRYKRTVFANVTNCPSVEAVLVYTVPGIRLLLYTRICYKSAAG